MNLAAGKTAPKEVSAVHSLSLDTTYGALRIRTHFASASDWEPPTMILQIDNDQNRPVRIRFADPDALDHLVAAVRQLQQDCRRHCRRIAEAANLHLVS